MAFPSSLCLATHHLYLCNHMIHKSGNITTINFIFPRPCLDSDLLPGFEIGSIPKSAVSSTNERFSLNYSSVHFKKFKERCVLEHASYSSAEQALTCSGASEDVPFPHNQLERRPFFPW